MPPSGVSMKQKTLALQGLFAENNFVRLALDVLAHTLDKARSRLLTAKAESKTKRQRERHHHTGEDGLEVGAHADYLQSGKNREDPYRPARNRSGKAGG